MFERMLDKKNEPTREEMCIHCGSTGSLFMQLNDRLSAEHNTAQSHAFPYGNKYGWCVAHRRKNKLICNIFAESGAFTVMLRMSNRQFDAVYTEVSAYTQGFIDHKYPCGDGGWIHYRVQDEAHLQDIMRLLSEKCK